MLDSAHYATQQQNMNEVFLIVALINVKPYTRCLLFLIRFRRKLQIHFILDFMMNCIEQSVQCPQYKSLRIQSIFHCDANRYELLQQQRKPLRKPLRLKLTNEYSNFLCEQFFHRTQNSYTIYYVCIYVYCAGIEHGGVLEKHSQCFLQSSAMN